MMMGTEAGSGVSKATSFGLQVIRGRWFTVFGTILIMTMSGTLYMFPVYSGVVKSRLGYTQTTLNLISLFKDLGGSFGLPSGLLMEVTPPWLVLSIAAALNLFGYSMIWLAVTSRIAKPAVWHMCLYTALASNFLCFSNTGAMVPCVMNFPEAQGVVLGLLKGFVGLSSAIINQLYHAVFVQNPTALILFLAILPTAITLVFVGNIRIIKGTTISTGGKDAKVFHQIIYMSLALAGFILTMIFLQARFAFSQSGYIGSATLVVLLLCLPLYSVFKQELISKTEHSHNETPRDETIDITPTREVDKWNENVFRPPQRGEDHTILQAVFSVDMIILFIVAIFGMGGNLTAIDNLGQIGTSLGYPKNSITTFVSLISIWNYLGRVSTGYLLEYLLSNYKLPRPLMVTFVTLLSCVGQLLIAFGAKNGLYAASVIIGFCYGAYWPLASAIISELFGLKYYSTLFSLGPLASPIGVYILNVRVTGELYDKEALRQMGVKGVQRKVGEELDCVGVKCFKSALLIITIVTAASVFVSLILIARTRKFYRGDIYRRFRKLGKTVDQSQTEGTK